MRLAKQCRLNVPGLEFREVLGRDIYLIERFDRTLTPHGVRRRPFASGLTMLGAHESDVGRNSYADLAAALRRYGADPRTDLVELYRRMVFNILVTNDDDHLRNHGFLWEVKGWRRATIHPALPAASDPEVLFQTHGSWLLGTLRRRFGPEVAEDLLQETYLRLVRQAEVVEVLNRLFLLASSAVTALERM